MMQQWQSQPLRRHHRQQDKSQILRASNTTNSSTPTTVLLQRQHEFSRSANKPKFLLRRSFIFCLFLLLTLSRATSFQQHSTVFSLDPITHHREQPPPHRPYQQNVHSDKSVQLSATAPPDSSCDQSFRRDRRSAPSRTSSRLHATRNWRQQSNKVVEAPTKAAIVSSTHGPSLPPMERIATLRLTTPSYLYMAPHVDETTEEYQRRKEEWARRYTSLGGLRDAFGSNRNKLWGDLDASTARRLYKSLLPTALCELVLDLGVRPEELAHLAYMARKAAKLYARERCRVPARVGATVFDGWRQFKRYGRFQPSGVSYDQLWEKYRHSIEEDLEDDIMTEEEIVAQTCLKILERSCKTNDRIDKMFLTPKTASKLNDNEQAREDLRKIAETLEMDVRKLLDPLSWDDHGDEGKHEKMRHRGNGLGQLTQRQYHALKLFLLSRRRVGPEAGQDDNRE